MTDDIRKAAIEAAAAQLHGYIAPQLAQDVARDAIDAYERAMWRHDRCHFAARYDVGECCGNPDACRHRPPRRTKHDDA